ncbi:MAG: hypothetical protein LBG95_05810, partial [Treponema sp.]|nr:hypothetical protein [Treponema sp.]
SGSFPYSLSTRQTQKKKTMRKISGDEGCHSTNAVLRHGVIAMTGPRMLIFAYTSFHAFVVGKLPYSLSTSH